MSSQDKHDKREKNARLALNVLNKVVEQYKAEHKAADRPPNDELREQVHWATQYATGQQDPQPQPEKQRLNILAALYGEAPPAESYLPLQELKLDSSALFPTAESADKAQKHADLLQKLVENLPELKEEADAVTQLRQALATLQQYGYALPSLYNPEVSLYDQARVVAALAVGYEAAHDEQKNPKQNVAILLKGDISGVQHFIYTITARGAASGLRGRSFYLQLLTEAIAHFVLSELGLPPSNMLYIGGGHFYLLLPADVEPNSLQEIQKEVSQKLLTYHGGELYVALGHIPFTAEMFCNSEEFGKGWRKLTEEVNRAKNTPFRELGQEMYGRVFALPKDEAITQNRGGGQNNDCEVCHYDGQDVKEDKLDENNPKRRFCPLCESLEQFGKGLRQADYLLLTEHAPQTRAERTFQSILRSFGLSAVESTAENIAENIEEQTKELNAYRHIIWQLKPTNNPLTNQFNTSTAIINRYTVQVIPELTQAEIDMFRKSQAEDGQFKKGQEKDNLQPGQVKPFDILTLQAEGIKRFGVLRMDVDNLGQVFSKGLAGQNSLVKTAALSLSITLYFEGWVGQLARQANFYPAVTKEPTQLSNLEEIESWPTGKVERDKVERDVVYSVYSGGDDLFVVAAWDVLPLLAYQVNHDFKRYASGNPHLHASAGISLQTAKFPIYQAAEAAAEALEAAKGLNGKNGFTFLGRTRPWKDFPEIWKEVVRLSEVMKSDHAPTRLLQMLRQFEIKYSQQVKVWRREQIQTGRNDTQPVFWGPWHWRTAYLLARLEERVSRNDKDLAEKIAKIRADLHLDKFSHIEKLGLAGRWVELALRNHSSKKE